MTYVAEGSLNLNLKKKYVRYNKFKSYIKVFNLPVKPHII